MRTATRHARAFTLIEVVVVAMVASVIFVFLTRWVLTLGQVTDHGLTAAAAARSTLSAETALARDTARVSPCDPASGGAVRTLTPSVLELYTAEQVTFTVDGHPPFTELERHLVRYEVAGSTLTRTVTVLDDRCRAVPSSGGSTAPQVVATGLATATATRRSFTGNIAGAAVTGDCTSSVSYDPATGEARHTSNGPACQATSLTVRVTAHPAGPGSGHDTTTRTFALPTQAGSR